jgi:hypothetical protein
MYVVLPVPITVIQSVLQVVRAIVLKVAMKPVQTDVGIHASVTVGEVTPKKFILYNKGKT